MSLPAPSRLAGHARLAAAALAAAAAGGTWTAWREISAHQYVAQAYERNAARVAAAVVDRWVLTGLGLALGYLALVEIARRLGARDRAWGLVLAATSAAAVALRLGWVWNRYTFAGLWRSRAEWHGLPVRRALLDGEVWQVNAAIVGGCALGGLAIYALAELARRRAAARSAAPGRTAEGGRRVRAAWRAAPAAGLLLWIAPHLAVALASRGPAPGGPSVIVISLDTLRGDHLGCYGYPRDTSPAIDRIAAESVRFANCFSQAPNTFPSHASLFTSLYPSVNLVSLEGMRLPRRKVTLPEIYREAGYRTCGIVDAGYLTGTFGMDQGYDDFTGWGRRIANIKPRALDWLERRGDRPFFLFLHCYDIHTPYATQPEYQARFHDFEYRGRLDPATKQLVAFMRHVVEGKPPPFEIGEEDVRHIVAYYDGGIRYTDDQLAGFFDRLRADGVLDRAVLVILSDHGEQFMEHGNVLHTELYRPVTNVPLIVRFPGARFAGTVVAEPVGLIDVLPTLLEVSGLKSPAPVQGRSLLPLIERSAAAPSPEPGAAGAPADSLAPEFVFGEFEAFGGRQAVYRGRHHYVNRLDLGVEQLFDAAADPLEQRDLAAEQPALLDSLRQVVRDWATLQQTIGAAEAGEPVETFTLDPRTRENLRALGYLQ